MTKRLLAMTKRLPVIGGGIAAVILAAALFLFVGLPGGGGESPAEPGAEGEVADEEAAAAEDGFVPIRVDGKLGPHVTLDDRVFTLMSPIDAPRYVKLRVVLEFETDDAAWFELAGEALEEEIEAFRAELPVALIEDAITTTVSSKSAADISSPAGKDALREEIRAAVAALLPDEHVRRVLFTNFITQ